MNLGKLLGAGKTFFGGQTPAAYRENKSVYLPKFNDGRNPFSSKPSTPAPMETEPTVAPAVPAPSSMAVPVVAMIKVAAAAPVVAVAPAKSVFSATPVAQVVAGPAKLPVAKQFRTPWAEKLNQIWAVAKLAPQPAPAGPMPTVQPELLSLDSVKVLHNDLTDVDVDVEVVPMKSRTVQAKPAPAAMSMDFLNEPTFKSA